MPAQSKSQQRFMAVCLHDPKHVNGQCPDMTRRQLHDFASTPHTGLPVHSLSQFSKKKKQGTLARLRGK